MKKLSHILIPTLLLAACAKSPNEMPTMGSFFDDHVAVLKHAPCEVVGGYEPFDMNPTHFSCAAGKWNEVSLRLDHNGEGETKQLTLYWREYPKGSFFEEGNETVLPFVDFITQRYATGAESEVYELVNENTNGKLSVNGLRFEHTVKNSQYVETLFEQHKLLIKK